ncbi:MAG: aminotransferase class III-fold pyridoxal phosphate-dependent enzyme, partial [Planctomycetota bacterium]
IEEEGLLQNAVELGVYLQENLNEMKHKHPIIEQVRGKGFMVGVCLKEPGNEIVDKCLKKGMRINCTQGNVLRFMAPMIVTKEQIDKALDIFDNVLSEMGK